MSSVAAWDENGRNAWSERLGCVAGAWALDLVHVKKRREGPHHAQFFNGRQTLRERGSSRQNFIGLRALRPFTYLDAFRLVLVVVCPLVPVLSTPRGVN